MPPDSYGVRATTTWDTASTPVSHILPVIGDGIILGDLLGMGHHSPSQQMPPMLVPGISTGIADYDLFVKFETNSLLSGFFIRDGTVSV